MTNEELDRLEALLAKATTRPWKVDTMDNVGENWMISGPFGEDPNGSMPIITTDNIDGMDCVAGLPSDDAKAMCASVMAADALVAEVRTLRGVVEAAEQVYSDLIKRADYTLDHMEDRLSDALDALKAREG